MKYLHYAPREEDAELVAQAFGRESSAAGHSESPDGTFHRSASFVRSRVRSLQSDSALPCARRRPRRPTRTWHLSHVAALSSVPPARRRLGYATVSKGKRSRRPRGHPAKVAVRRERDAARRSGTPQGPDGVARRIVREALELTSALDAELWASYLLGVFWDQRYTRCRSRRLLPATTASSSASRWSRRSHGWEAAGLERHSV